MPVERIPLKAPFKPRDPQAFVDRMVEQIREQVDGPAVLGLSGGVDSTTAAAIVHKALGDDLHSVFVDNGLLRKNERETVENMVSRLGLPLETVDASEEFFKSLEGVTEPELKRERIGNTFIDVFMRTAERLGAKYLVQGTIAPDWIESGGGARDVIKSHHNVGGLPEEMGLTLIEPLRDLYKDQVRILAEHFELEVAQKQPFPGPGLAVRVLGEVTPERTAVVREACAIVEEELDKLDPRPWQYFAVLLPIQSVGVHGDVRAYGDVIAVRSVECLDGMSATYTRIPEDVLDRISIRITNTMKEKVNRVVYDVTNKPPATIEWE